MGNIYTCKIYIQVIRNCIKYIKMFYTISRLNKILLKIRSSIIKII